MTKHTRNQDASSIAVYTLRAKRETLDRMREIASAEHLSLNSKLLRMIDAELADHEAGEQAA